MKRNSASSLMPIERWIFKTKIQTKKQSMKNWWLLLTCTISVGLNAVLLCNQNENSSQTTSLSKLLQDLNAEDIVKVGQLFFHQQVSEILMPRSVQKEVNFNNQSWDEEKYVTGLGLDLLSVPISDEERHMGKLTPETSQKLIDRLNVHGVVVIPELFGRDRCRKVAHRAHEQILNPTTQFGSIMERAFRKDYPLPLEGDAFEMMRDAVDILEPFLSATLGPDSLLKEFSSLTSYPNATSQVFHADAHMEDPRQINSWAKMFSMFVYLDDVREDSAPFDVYPGTHTHYHFLSEDEKQMMGGTPFVRLAVPQGSIAIYDSRTLHRGSGNTSPYVRPTLYFSLAQNQKEEPEGPTYSLRKSYHDAKVSMRDILARNIPPRRPTTLESSHDDAKCLESIQSACPGKKPGNELFDCSIRTLGKYFETNFGHANPLLATNIPMTELQDPLLLAEGHPLQGCTLSSRVEKLCEFGIFDPAVEAKVSWGRL